MCLCGDSRTLSYNTVLGVFLCSALKQTCKSLKTAMSLKCSGSICRTRAADGANQGCVQGAGGERAEKTCNT